MKVIERRLLRGPSIHSFSPCFLAIVDLEALDDVSSTALPGFVDRLLHLVPTLAEHRCSPGYVGGFVERLRDGTYMAHIVEHVTIELQCLAGNEVGFGKARSVRGKARHYRIVVAYRVERVVEAAFDLALELVEALAAGQEFALQERLQALREMAERAALGPSTKAIIEAAEQRDIPVLRLTDNANLFQLGWGVRQQRIQATTTSQTNYIAVGIASDKELTKRLLDEAGLPAPQGETVETLEAAERFRQQLGRPVAVKPLDGNQGKGVSTAIADTAALAAAFEEARRFSRRVIVEQHIEGDDYRALVIGKNLVAAARRVPPQVVGDGRSTIRQLVEAINRDPLRGVGHENVLTQVRLDTIAAEELQRQGHHFESVPAAGEAVRLRGNANLSTGGSAEDVTNRVHPDTACACVRAARKIGLDVAGIDLVCADIGAPLAEQGGAIIEVNAAPGIRMHEHPSQGERHHVGRAVIESLFPDEGDGRIPVVAVTGTNGKTTTTLAIGHVMQRHGCAAGVTTTEGIFINGQKVAEGDCTGYWSARTVLTSPEVEFAALETARGGLLKRGLAFDRCDVGVVLNVDGDHLGQDGIDTIDDLAEVKGLVVEAARTAVVLNAEDPVCVRMARKAARGVEVIYFSQDAQQSVFADHLVRRGRGAYARDGMLMWADGAHHVPLCSSARLPFTFNGKARHNVANALAVFAALIALKVPRERIVSGLGTFTSNENQNPLRLNVYRTQGVTLLVDYAHNPAAYRAVIDTGRRLTSGRLLGVCAAPGDRRDDDLLEIGRICGSGFDELVIYEMDDRRGRLPGATGAILRRGALAAAHEAGPHGANATRKIDLVLDVRQAIAAALKQAAPGDLIVVGCASHLSDFKSAVGTGEQLSLLDAATFAPESSPQASVGALHSPEAQAA